MKKLGAFSILILTIVNNSVAQSNVFPSSGNVGIGTMTPTTKLQVKGTTTTNLVALEEDANVISYFGRGESITGAFNAVPNILALTYMKRDFAIGGWGKTTASWNGISFYINSDSGNIGIGTTTPDAKLAVNGLVHAKEVKVDLQGWPDYVFESEYQLPSLDTVKRYIDLNHHLPEIPSASEVETYGINLGEINKVLTKKIEELTLYLIEKDVEVNSLKSQLKVVDSKFKNQQEQLDTIKLFIKNLQSRKKYKF